MQIEKYIKKFTAVARESGKDDEYIVRCLNYFDNITNKGLPVIYDQIHFCDLVGIDYAFILKITNSQKNFYRYFYIPKSNGQKRRIAEPLPMLKDIQRFILKNILYKIKCSSYSKAFKQGSSIKDNAKFHCGQKWILKIDLKDYFDNLKEKRVYNYFIQLGYSKDLCTLITKLCVLKHALPQGAPTSPYLSNLLTQDLDKDLFDLCQCMGLRYSRYADDITISGDFNAKDLIPRVLKIIYSHELKVNYDKINVIGQNRCQRVTGIVVNKKMQAPKNYRKNIRQQVYYIKKYGIDSVYSRIKDDQPDKKHYIKSLLGKVSFCLQINKKDSKLIEYKSFLLNQLLELNKKT